MVKGDTMDDVFESIAALKRAEAEAEVGRAKVRLVDMQVKQTGVDGFCKFLDKAGQESQLKDSCKGLDLNGLVDSYKKLLDLF